MPSWSFPASAILRVQPLAAFRSVSRRGIFSLLPPLLPSRSSSWLFLSGLLFPLALPNPVRHHIWATSPGSVSCLQVAAICLRTSCPPGWRWPPLQSRSQQGLQPPFCDCQALRRSAPPCSPAGHCGQTLSFRPPPSLS